MFYFLLAFAAVLATTANAGHLIRDVEGVPVFNGSYYLLPRLYKAYGGLTLSSRGDNQCPLYVGLELHDYNRGIPVIISHWLSTVDYIYETEDLYIKMDVNATTCAQPTYWSDPPARTVIEGVFIVAGPRPSSGSFQIKKTENLIGSYKIMFCPTGKDCTDVGLFVDHADGVLRLALGFPPYIIVPFEFVFVKATGTETSSQTMSII
ncbi:hypothetical protein Bca4012_027822 [Brassica carinata]